MLPEIIRDLTRWETGLGPGADRDHPLSWAGASHENDREAAGALKDALYRIGFHQVFVPESAGGLRRNWLQLWLRTALAARRNVSVMPAVMYSVGPVAVVEMAGSAGQRELLFASLADREQVCFGLSEATAGTELLNIATRAEQRDGGWQITGRKGPLGWSDRVRRALILARTAEAGPASLSFFLVPLEQAGMVRRYRGWGMYGQSFVELTFDGVGVSGEALVGEPGHGFEVSLKVQQLVKYLSTAANAGGCHNLLRDVAGFARASRHQRRLSDHAHVRLLLGRSVSDLLLTEAAALAAGCLVGARRSQFSVAASVAKQVAMDSSEAIVARLRDILSVNYALDREPIFYRFHKVQDDLSMVRYMDTNPVVNLKNIATQLPAIRAQWDRLDERKADEQLEYLLELFNLDRAYGAKECINLAVTNARGDWVLNALHGLSQQWHAPGPARELQDATRRVKDGLDAFWLQLSQIEERSLSQSAAAIELAADYCRLHSCASLVLLCIANPDFAPSPTLVEALIALCLQPGPATRQQEETAYAYLAACLEDDTAVSLLPIALNEYHGSKQ